MNRTTLHISGFIVAVAVAASMGAACGGSSTLPTSPTPVSSTSGALLSGMTSALQAEYKSEAIYARVLADFGVVLPFATIVEAERMHVSSVAALFTSRSLAIPVSEWTTSNAPRFLTVREACANAAASERGVVALYDSLLAANPPRDVWMVYTNLRSASFNNHLPAFEACS